MSACHTARSDDLAGDHARVVALRRGLDDEAEDLARVGVPGPHDHDVGDRRVADPALDAVEDPVVAVAAGGGLQRDGVGSVIGLGERERPDRVQCGHRRQPALLLLLRAAHRDRLHGQPGVHAEEGAQRPVAAVQLHVDEPAGHGAHAGGAVAVDVLADDLQLGQPPEQVPGQLGLLPVVADVGQHLLVDEPPDGDEPLPLLPGELLAHREEVRAQCLAEMLVGGHRPIVARGRSRHPVDLAARDRHHGRERTITTPRPSDRTCPH